MRLLIWPYYFFELIVVIIWEILLSNIRLAQQMAKPLEDLKPGIISVPLDVSSATQMTVLANLVTLTPGTLSLDIDHISKTLIIHTIDATYPDRVRNEIKSILEKRVMRVFP